MQIGDKEGLNNVYTPEGEPILKDGEEILVHDEDFIPNIKTTWGYFGGEPMNEPSKGDIYLTNQRLIYIMKLGQSIQRVGGTSSTIIAPQSYAMQMKSVAKLQNIDEMKGVRDYFEIPIKEILGCEIKPGVVSGGSQVNVYILSKGEQCHLSFVIPSESGLFKRFQQKQVSGVDELTANLKQHFENTDWIYLKEEGEGGETTTESSDTSATAEPTSSTTDQTE
jgi:hypothetical protein